MTPKTGNILLKVIIGFLLMCLLVPNAQSVVYPSSSTPNGYRYYPLPQDTVGISMFLADVYKYYEAKKLRNDSIKLQLNEDMKWGVDDMMRQQIPAFGFKPSTSQAPALRQLLVDSYTTFSAASSFKGSVRRVRPCRRLRESTFGVESATASDFKPGSSSEFSFPSSHACTSWGIALLLTCMNPWNADTIISRGLAHSQSRVIGGVHWQSDVDAGKVLATANYARMFGFSNLLDRLDQARAETQSELGMSERPSFEQMLASDDTLALLTCRLPGPYEMTTPVGSCELAVLNARMSHCTAATVAAAKQQVDLSTDNLLACFSSQLGTTITAESHPATYALVDMHLRMCRKMHALMQGRYNKPRPVDYFDFANLPLTGEDVDSLRSSSPYPSLHSALGWTAAMVLMNLNPGNVNNILKQGVNIGENRIAVGATWPGDVEMGRVMASIAYGYTTACREYTDMARAALTEFSIP